MKRVQSIIISDTHLGTRDCQAEALSKFLNSYSCTFLYLNGDIIDLWRIKQNKWVWFPSHTEVIKAIIKHSKRTNTVVLYSPGNHEDVVRPFLEKEMVFDHLVIATEFRHVGLNGKQYLVTHGDVFDGIGSLAPWLAILGDKAYDVILSLNSRFNWFRRLFGFGYWSLSKYLKHKVKGAVDFIFKFENNLADYAHKHGYDAVICGHIHHAEIKVLHDIIYMNSGDWVESRSALIENLDGSWEIKYF